MQHSQSNHLHALSRAYGEINVADVHL